uniref:G_PROTEIN_RECEP_F1_2 domain-containing protein n=1 Tax=Rhabditophanes sp. KR3021 TaxID=114890 RepID=A0AC35UH25_9BILA
LVGNISVLTLMKHLHTSHDHTSIPMDNTMIYVLFLCIVDLASIAPLPLTILDQCLGFWIFSTVTCKVYRCLEQTRCLSTFIQAAVSFDRYLLVCYPYQVRSRKVILSKLAGMALLSVILLAPVVYVSRKTGIVISRKLLMHPPRILEVTIFKCMANFESDESETIYVVVLFILGFVVPMILIISFYSLMVKSLFKRSKTLPTSNVPVNRIALYTMSISVFYFVCYSFYWCSTIYQQFKHMELEKTKYIFMYVIHAFPYVNSSMNWLIYGLLNSQLMRKTNRTYKSLSFTDKTTSAKKRIDVNLEILHSKKDESDPCLIKPQSTDSFL